MKDVLLNIFPDLSTYLICFNLFSSDLLYIYFYIYALYIYIYIYIYIYAMPTPFPSLDILHFRSFRDRITVADEK